MPSRTFFNGQVSLHIRPLEEYSKAVSPSRPIFTILVTTVVPKPRWVGVAIGGPPHSVQLIENSGSALLFSIFHAISIRPCSPDRAPYFTVLVDSS